jgi:hypothetical protein
MMLRWALAVLMALVLFLVGGGIPVAGGGETVVFRTPVFLLLVVVLGGLLVACCLRWRGGIKGVFFLLAHLGGVWVIAGAGVGYVMGRQGQVALPIGGWHAVDALPGRDSAAAAFPLGFSVSVSRFNVEYYSEQEGSDGGRVPRLFEAFVEVAHGDARVEHVLRVNHPLSIDGWRIYLMSHSQTPRPYVVLLLRRDPGRLLVLAGIWCLILGVAGLCWGGDTGGRTKGGSDA